MFLEESTQRIPVSSRTQEVDDVFFWPHVINYNGVATMDL